MSASDAVTPRGTAASGKRNIEAVYDLSPMQQGMLFHSLYAPGSGVYLEQLTCTLRGSLNVEAFRRAWLRVIERHAVLRTAFAWKKLEKPVQAVAKEVALPLTELDWRNLTPAEQASALAAFLAEDRQRGFDLARAPLLRLALIRIAEDVRRLVWSHHHLLLDGWSMPVLLREVFSLYEGEGRGQPPTLPAVRPYKDYIAWLQKQDRAAAETYWRGALAGFTAPTPLAVDRPTGRPAGPLEQEIRLDAAATAAVDSMARQQGLTLSTIVQGAWALLLHRYSGEDDVIFGATVAGRPAALAGSERMVGLFINTLPVRVSIPADRATNDWLSALQAQLAEARQFEHTPLVDIQGWSGAPRDVPLFDTIVVFENYPVEEALREQLGSLVISDVRSFEQTNYPLTLVSGPGRELTLKISYDAARFDDVVIARMLGHLRVLLGALAEKPKARLAELPLLTQAELQQVTQAWNDTARTFDGAGLCLHELFEAQTARTPDAVAAIAPAANGGSQRSLTYAELNARANRLANALRRMGVTRETLVGLHVRRSPEMLVGLLGILKAGGAYLPLDPDYPAERLAFMIEDSGIRCLVTQQGLSTSSWGAAIEIVIELCLDHDCLADEADGNLMPAATADSLAYVIYTSGSTGAPKGVMVEHRSVVNHALAFMATTGLQPGDRVLQFVSLSFDAAGEEFYPTLLSGATLVLPVDGREMIGVELPQFCERHAITVMHMPAAVWHSVIDELDARAVACNAPLRLLALGGDAPDASRLRAFKAMLGRDIPFINLYGPTEATITTTMFVTTLGDAADRVPIGRPIANAQVYLLDRAGRPAPWGAAGEIYIGGRGVARGYLRRPELTQERFVPNPLGAGRLYRTGDLARWSADGQLEFVGRADNQIKIRGFRVEPGEIEAALAALPAVREAIVIAQEGPGGTKRLVAYVVPAEGASIEIEEVRAKLRRRLPEHMIPAVFVMLPALPLTTTGKVDRRALPAPETNSHVERSQQGPRTMEEELLCGIFGQVLGLSAERIAVTDSFFDLGGHSLLATRLASRLREVFGVDFPLRALFDAPTVAGMATLIAAERGAADVAAPRILPLPRDEQGLPVTPPPLSYAQQRLWFLDQLEPGNLFYNIPTVVRLSGALDVIALQAALNQIVQRHEVLRTTFAARSGVPYQVIAASLSVDLPLVDLTDLPAEGREAEAHRLAREELRRPFDLARGPLLRGRLLRLDENEHLAMLTVHHSVTDGWSMGVLIAELAALYARATGTGGAPPLPGLPIQYADFATWQRGWLAGASDANTTEAQPREDATRTPLQAQLDYWTHQLAGLPQRLDVPTDRPRPPMQTANGSTYTFVLSAELTGSLRRLAQQQGVTLFMALLAGYQALLARYSGQNDIAVGTAIANRTRSETEPLIGFFVNTLVLRTRFSDDITVKELLARVRETALGAFAHQDLPFEMLVDALQPERNLSHTPLFQAGFSWQNVPVPTRELPGLRLAPVEVDKGIAGFDMLLQMTETENGIAAAWEYNSDLFDRSTIVRMADHLQVLIGAAAANPTQPVAALPILTDAERRQMLNEWNATETSYPEASFLALFDEWVRATPDGHAVEFAADGRSGEREILTYAELARRAALLADRLISTGVARGDLVGVCAERSLDVAVSILAILRAGAAYLPLDPHYPADRLAFMIADSGVKVIITQREVAARVNLAGTLMYADDAGLPGMLPSAADPIARHGTSPDTGPDDLAYCIYTSGSTGRPKGALLLHRGLVNLALVHRREFDMKPGQRVLQFAPLSFDASVWEMAMALGNGATLVLTRQETLTSGGELLKLLQIARITAVTLPPSLLSVLEPAALPDLQLVVAAGERCTNEIVARWAESRRFFNAYGPTETTVCATMYRCAPDASWDFGGPPIGGPLSNFKLYVVDAHMQPQPIGVAGELLIGGVGLAIGYHRRPELTAERFLMWGPESAAERVYRSGDLVRWLPDGSLEFLGRIDDQVKVRGFRIELGEIEAQLREQPGVQDAAVVARGDTLVAYVTPRAAGDATEELPRLAAGELRAGLRARLPEYMIPHAFVTLPAFPLSPAGKVDRRALPAPDATSRETGAEYVAPRTPLEEQLAALCAQLLGLERVGVEDNFFELGGHSLLATQLMARIRDAHHVELPLRALFEHPTVAGIAHEVEQAREADAAHGLAEQSQKLAETLRRVQDLSPEQVRALLAQKRGQSGADKPPSSSQ